MVIFLWIKNYWDFFFQVAIKIIDKKALNANSLQKVSFFIYLTLKLKKKKQINFTAF